MERYAILIGVDDQDEDGLHYCSKDVEDLATVLERYCKFKAKNIFKVVSKYKSENQEASIEFESRIDLLKADKKITSSDLLLIYFSGHGNYDSKLQQSFLEFPTESVSTQKVKSYIDSLSYKQAIIIFDACFVGAKIYSKSFNLRKLKRKLQIDSEGVFGIYASPIVREAFMPPGLDNSLLTYHFIEALKNTENYDEDNALSIDTIASICSKSVYKHSYDLMKKGVISKEQIIVREGRIEGWLPFAEIEQTKGKSNLKHKQAKALLPPVHANNTRQPGSAATPQEIDKFNILLNDVKDRLKAFKPVIAAKILCYYSDKPYNPNYRDYQSELHEAVRRNILDDELDVRTSNGEVESLISSIDKLISFITSENRTDSFDEFFTDEYETSPNEYDSQDFWESVYDFSVPFEGN